MSSISIPYKDRVHTVNTGLFINNQFVPGTDGVAPLIDPATEQSLGNVAVASSADVASAVAAAKAAGTPGSAWQSMTPMARGELLRKWADLIEANRECLAVLESRQMGKPFFESFNFDLEQVISNVRYFAGWPSKHCGKQIPQGPGVLAFVTNEPLGVVGLITPFNFPMQISVGWKMAPLLATGNTCVVKPATQTPLSLLKVAELAAVAGFPPGVINIVPGAGSKIGNVLCAHPDVSKIGFTGSTGIGAAVMRACATDAGVKPCQLELGGKSALIVFDDVADFDACVTDAFYAVMWNAGQCCSAASRFYVHAAIYERFVNALREKCLAVRLGDPLDDGVTQGPQATKGGMETTLRYVEAGKTEGARLVCGGKRWGSKGYFVEPTVFADVQDGMTIAREEVFGPLACVLKFTDEEDVIARANNSPFGLVAAVFTANADRLLRVTQRMVVGTVWGNSYNIINAACPWSGRKQSGFGQDASEWALSNYTAPRATIIKFSTTPKM